MPAMPGLEFVGRVRSIPDLRHVAFVMCTSVADEQTIAGAFALGAWDYIVKPVDPPVVTAKLRRALHTMATTMEPVRDTCVRLGVTQTEYAELAASAVPTLVDLSAELEAIEHVTSTTSLIRLIERIGEPAHTFGAARCLAACQQVRRAMGTGWFIVDAGIVSHGMRTLTAEVGTFEASLLRAARVAMAVA
jgi:response regulator RpfG family c-di-GMP phosphodiesterase